jgi:L-alanine-DL-glutamate epimerase-like enolase superfamily enzyme
MTRTLAAKIERWPIAGRFAISRGARTEAQVIVAEITEGPHVGRGECVPYPRYGESVASVAAEIASMTARVNNGLQRFELQTLMRPGAARNAIDCALWDLDAKKADIRVWELAGLPDPQTVTTAYTLSLDTPEEMQKNAEAAAHRPLLKVKLGAPSGDAQRIRAVRKGAPNSELIVDANEGWTPKNIESNLAACAKAGVKLIEQPLPAAADSLLKSVDRTVPICADESVHIRAGLASLKDRYDAVNIKLDKTGGLTEALELIEEAERLGFLVMVGCMVGTSLAMAPAMLLAGRARWVDLDGPLLLAKDRPDGLKYEGSTVHPPERKLWG